MLGRESQALFPAVFIVVPPLSLSGEFAIRPEKKADPVTKKVKYVGMIAGGTGMCVCVKIRLWPSDTC